jgi:hypothetical protein
MDSTQNSGTTTFITSSLRRVRITLRRVLGRWVPKTGYIWNWLKTVFNGGVCYKKCHIIWFVITDKKLMFV